MIGLQAVPTAHAGSLRYMVARAESKRNRPLGSNPAAERRGHAILPRCASRHDFAHHVPHPGRRAAGAAPHPTPGWQPVDLLPGRRPSRIPGVNVAPGLNLSMASIASRRRAVHPQHEPPPRHARGHGVLQDAHDERLAAEHRPPGSARGTGDACGVRAHNGVWFRSRSHQRVPLACGQTLRVQHRPSCGQPRAASDLYFSIPAERSDGLRSNLPEFVTWAAKPRALYFAPVIG